MVDGSIQLMVDALWMRSKILVFFGLDLDGNGFLFFFDVWDVENRLGIDCNVFIICFGLIA